MADECLPHKKTIILPIEKEKNHDNPQMEISDNRITNNPSSKYSL